MYSFIYSIIYPSTYLDNLCIYIYTFRQLLLMHTIAAVGLVGSPAFKLRRKGVILVTLDMPKLYITITHSISKLAHTSLY